MSTSLYEPPTFECYRVSDTERTLLQGFLRDGLARFKQVVVPYPAATQGFTAFITDSRDAPSPMWGPPPNVGSNPLLISILGLRAILAPHPAGVEAPKWVGDAEGCAHVFDCSIHLGADISNLLSILYDSFKESLDVSR